MTVPGWMLCEHGHTHSATDAAPAQKDQTPPVEEETTFPSTQTALELRTVWSCVSTVPETKNDYAGEGQQQFTGPGTIRLSGLTVRPILRVSFVQNVSNERRPNVSVVSLYYLYEITGRISMKFGILDLR
jgi:hypothetical protein